MSLTIHSIRAVDNTTTVPTSADKQALVSFEYNIAALIDSMERAPWQHDDQYSGPCAALLAQYRADLVAVRKSTLAAFGVRVL